MKLYEINKEIEDLINEETGEIADFEAFERLSLEREIKLEGMGLLCKNMTADIKALKEEEDKLAQRRRSAEASIKRLKEYIDYNLKGEKFETAKVKMYSRKASAVEIDDGFIKWAAEDAPDLLRWKQPEPDKAKIKERITGGHEVPHARISENTSLIIK